MIFESLFKAIGSIITGVARLLTCLMSFPYGVLRWLALLFFRIVEAMGKDTYSKVRTRIGKTPRE